jgi:hypothetical protein
MIFRRLTGSELITVRIVLSALIIIGSVVVINMSKQSRTQRKKDAVTTPAD